MKRRKFLKTLLSASIMMGMGVKAKEPLSEIERDIGVLMDLIIPKTNTPSATDLLLHIKSPVFIKNHIHDLNKFYNEVRFISDKKSNYISDDEFVNKWINGYFGDEYKSLFYFIKKMTVRMYCSSENVTRNTFEYIKIPGSYIGSFPFNKVNKVWAT